MRCCGNKRKEWLNRARISAHQITLGSDTDFLVTDKLDKMFEYTGDYSLIIRGVASKRTYHFKYKGDKIKVDYSDSFALMGERDLKISPAEVKDI